MTDTATPFDPSRFLSRIGSSDYLEVKWRLVWLRQTNPSAMIETELISHVDQTAIFKARVVIPDGGSATGYGTETADDFRDYIEKAETKAIGRALAALGFGTQFCPDFEFGAAHGRVVDSPVSLPNRRSEETRVAASRERSDSASHLNQAATPKQITFIRSIAQQMGIGEDQLEAETTKAFGKAVAELDRRDASSMIERLQSKRQSAPSDIAA